MDATTSSVLPVSTLLSTPMILQDEVVGLLSMWRTNVAPFDAVVRTPRGSPLSAIVLRQVHLMRALESRFQAGQQVAQLEALRELGETHRLEPRPRRGLGPDRQQRRAAHPRTDGGSIMEYDEAGDSVPRPCRFRQQPRPTGAAPGDHDPPGIDPGGSSTPSPTDSRVPDLAQTELDPHLDILFRDGWRSVLAVPMLRGDKMVGVLVIRRRSTGTFPPM